MIDKIRDFELAKLIIKSLTRGSNELGIIYYDFIKEACDDGRFLRYMINDITIGFAVYSVKKRKRFVDVDYIYVDELKRCEGIGSALIKQIYISTKSLYENLGYVMRIKVLIESDSNKFFHKIASSEEYDTYISKEDGLTHKTITYIILPNKLEHLKI